MHLEFKHVCIVIVLVLLNAIFFINNLYSQILIGAKAGALSTGYSATTYNDPYGIFFNASTKVEDSEIVVNHGYSNKVQNLGFVSSFWLNDDEATLSFFADTSNYKENSLNFEEDKLILGGGFSTYWDSGLQNDIQIGIVIFSQYINHFSEDEKIYDKTIFGLNLGASYLLTSDLMLALAINEIVSENYWQFGSASDDSQVSYRMGFAYKPDGFSLLGIETFITLSSDLVVRNNKQEVPMGLELDFIEKYFLRFGYVVNNGEVSLLQHSLGLGVKVSKNLTIDYAYLYYQFDYLNFTDHKHIIDLSYKF